MGSLVYMAESGIHAFGAVEVLSRRQNDIPRNLVPSHVYRGRIKGSSREMIGGEHKGDQRVDTELNKKIHADRLGGLWSLTIHTL
jgi:hypothetical protein